MQHRLSVMDIALNTNMSGTTPKLGSNELPKGAQPRFSLSYAEGQDGSPEDLPLAGNQTDSPTMLLGSAIEDNIHNNRGQIDISDLLRGLDEAHVTNGQQIEATATETLESLGISASDIPMPELQLPEQVTPDSDISLIGQGQTLRQNLNTAEYVSTDLALTSSPQLNEPPNIGIAAEEIPDVAAIGLNSVAVTSAGTAQKTPIDLTAVSTIKLNESAQTADAKDLTATDTKHPSFSGNAVETIKLSPTPVAAEALITNSPPSDGAVNVGVQSVRAEFAALKNDAATQSDAPHFADDMPIKPTVKLSDLDQKVTQTASFIESLKPAGDPSVLFSAATTSTVDVTARAQQAFNLSALPSQAHPALQQVAESLIKAHITQNGISIRIDPPEMGNVSIQFQFDADRNVTAVVRAEVPETAALLRERADVLIQALKDNGFDNINLSFEQGQQSGQELFGSEQMDELNMSSMSGEAANDLGINLQETNVRQIYSDGSKIDMKL